MTVTIHQPDFLPWLGFFERWRASDLYVILDDVQFLRRGWHHRDKIKTPNGAKWLTIPVRKKKLYSQKINTVQIDYCRNWQKELFGTIYHAYSKAPNFAHVFHEISTIIDQDFPLLLDLNIALLKYCAAALEITTPMVFASEFNVASFKTDRLIELMQAVNGKVYLTGLGSEDYLEEEKFSQAGIGVRWQHISPTPYPQLYGEYLDKLSVLDYLMMQPAQNKF